MQKVIFTDETRATFNSPDGWAKLFRRQQGEREVMIRAGIIRDKIICSIKVLVSVKIFCRSGFVSKNNLLHVVFIYF